MTSRTRDRHATRAAFTLPEMLVVITVTLILMSILVQASTVITSTVSEAKAQGDFVSQERMALAVMRRDLQYDHFLDEDTKPNQGRKVSDQRSDFATKSGTTITGYKPPRSGYFWASARPAQLQGTPYNAADPNTWSVEEGTDTSGFGSSRSGNHFIQFTVVLPGGSPENTLTATTPDPVNGASTNQFIGTCAEIAYYLEPNLTTPGGVPKYKLIRRQRLVARNTDDAPAYTQILNKTTAPVVSPATDPAEVMVVTGNVGSFQMRHMGEMPTLGNRLFGTLPPGGQRTAITTHRVGEDVLHNHVTSFELKFTGSSADGSWPRPFAQNTDYPYDTLPYNGEYDTGEDALLANATANLATNASRDGRIKPIRITGVQIRLRCWNPSNRQTRQTTTVVDL